jgi:hypothetical protein
LQIPPGKIPEEICRKASAVHVSLSQYSIVKEQINRQKTPYQPIARLAPFNQFRHEPNQCLISPVWKASQPYFQDTQELLSG